MTAADWSVGADMIMFRKQFFERQMKITNLSLSLTKSQFRLRNAVFPKLQFQIRRIRDYET